LLLAIKIPPLLIHPGSIPVSSSEGKNLIYSIGEWVIFELIQAVKNQKLIFLRHLSYLMNLQFFAYDPKVGFPHHLV